MDSADLGHQIRAARHLQKLSLRGLGTEIGVSASLLSQIETGKTKPSVDTLYALVDRLGLSTDEVLGLNPAPNLASSLRAETLRLQTADENPTLEMESGVRWEKLPVFADLDLEGMLVTYQPGGSSSVDGRLMRHLGVEHVYVIEGELHLQFEFDTHTLRCGDSVVFSSERPHLFSNRSDGPARGLWYILTAKDEMTAQVARSADPTAAPYTAVDVSHAFRG